MAEDPRYNGLMYLHGDNRNEFKWIKKYGKNYFEREANSLNICVFVSIFVYSPQYLFIPLNVQLIWVWELTRPSFWLCQGCQQKTCQARLPDGISGLSSILTLNKLNMCTPI